jgi:uncharacterized RmlC-like cupin family protein
MKAIVPPGAAIPLHSHPDPEALLLLEGSLNSLQYVDGSHRWLTATSGDVISVPPNVKHSFRNTSSQPAYTLLITTPNIYDFFRELGKTIDQDHPPALPTLEDMQRLLLLSQKYNYWMASPQENAAIGLPGF